MKVHFEIKNFKKIKSESLDFESGNIYIVGGPNNIGKTSFLQAISSLIKGEAIKTNNVSFGETEGQVKGEFEFEGANKGKYLLKWDFTDEKNTFTIIDPLTNVKKSTPRNNLIAEIFKYNAFSIDEWFGWGLTSEGRKKQADIILNLLTEKSKKEYLDIESKVNNKTGSLYIERTSVNNTWEANKKVLESYKVSEEDILKLDKEQTYVTLLEDLKKGYDTALASNKEELLLKETSIKQSIANIPDEIENYLKSSNTSINFLNDEIKDLELMIERKKQSITKINEDTAQFKKDKVNESFNLTEELKTLQAKIASAGEVQDPKIIKERIEKGEKLINEINIIKNKQQQYDKYLTVVQESFDKKIDLDTKIEKLRNRKEEIISENKIPIKNLVINDGEAYYVTKEGEQLPFIKDSVSYSEGGMIIIELMALINKTLPIWLVGSAESYDKSRMKELQKIVDKYQGIMFLDKVIEEGPEELTIKVVEK